MTLDIELLDETQREALIAFGRLMEQRTELAALTQAATSGQLVQRPLSVAERETVRDALAFAHLVVSVDQIRNAILAGQS